MTIKGMSIEAIMEILEVKPATISNWLFRAAKQCDIVNENLMKNLNVTRVEMDELWVITEKKLHQKPKLKVMKHGCG